MTLFFQWIDGIWILLALLLARKKQRLISVLFILSCMMIMRLQIEMLAGAGFAYGALRLIPYDIFIRGLVTYSLFYIVYFGFLRISPGSRGSLLLAFSISIFFIAFFLSTLVMLL